MPENIMNRVEAVLKSARRQLQKDAERIKKEISRIDTILRSAGGRGKGGRQGTQTKKRRGGRRRLTAAGRARIAAAQRKRWAKVRAKNRRKVQ